MMNSRKEISAVAIDWFNYLLRGLYIASRLDCRVQIRQRQKHHVLVPLGQKPRHSRSMKGQGKDGTDNRNDRITVL